MKLILREANNIEQRWDIEVCAITITEYFN